MGVMQPSNLYISQPPRSISDTHYCVMGDVTVDSTAAIAPGVVLQAASGSRIIIEKGACLAGGVCIQSRQGILKVGAGASLGANVLIIGHGTVGADACISPSSTVVNPQIAQSVILPPCSLIEPASQVATRQVNASQAIAYPVAASSTASNYSQPSSDELTNTFVEPPPIGPKPITTPDLSDQNGQYQESVATQNGYGRFTNDVQLNNSPSSGSNNGNGLAQTGSSSLTVQSNGYVYGREQVSELISTLFPNRLSS
jgi:carbon dioxide concentrating mechanism protein CcmN